MPTKYKCIKSLGIKSPKSPVNLRNYPKKLSQLYLLVALLLILSAQHLAAGLTNGALFG